jgi:AraC-like DNA-binding protein
MLERLQYSIDRPYRIPPGDVISSILSLLSPSTSMSAIVVTGGDWSIDAPPPDGLVFIAVKRGSCWLAVEGAHEPIYVETGHCYVIKRGHAYRHASDLSLKPINAATIWKPSCDGRVFHGMVHDTELLGGQFNCDSLQFSILLDTLPPVIVIRSKSNHACAIPWLLDRLMKELIDDNHGSVLIIDHLAHMLLIEILRAHIASGEDFQVGWLRGLADPKIAIVLNLMHRDPGYRWTLKHFTQATSMSRSAFLSLFKSRVGTGPLNYLLRWRMQLAAKRLLAGNESVNTIALSLGYESESAFGNAFKRVTGESPRSFAMVDFDEHFRDGRSVA